MKNSTFLFSLILSIFWLCVSGQGLVQQQVKTETDANSGQKITFQSGLSQQVEQFKMISDQNKDAGINWQFADPVAVGSRTKVSSQTGQTFTSWWLNDQRISMYGNSSSPLWELPFTSEWEWPIDMTENGEWVASGSGTMIQVFMESSSTVFWELTVAGSVTGVKTSIRFLEKIMVTPDFVEGKYNTHFIEKNRDFLMSPPPPNPRWEDVVMMSVYVDYLQKLDSQQSKQQGKASRSNWKECGRKKNLFNY